MQTSYNLKNPLAIRRVIQGAAGALCLLSMGAASAQQTRPAIVLSDDVNGGVSAIAPAAAPLAAPPQPQSPTLLSFKFEEAPVAKVLSMIADQGGVDIIINGDVQEIVRFISINDKTPEEAIRSVVQATNLQFRRLENRTYMIGKSFPNDISDNAGRMVSTDTSRLVSPEEKSGTVSVIPEIPDLVGVGSDREREPSIFQAFPVRNVPPRIMAFWLDPGHQSEPIEFQASSRSRQNAAKPPKALERAIPAEEDMPFVMTTNASSSGYGSASPQTYVRASEQFATPNRGGQTNQNQNGATGNTTGGQGLFELPDGVDSIVAIDPQSVILVRGTPAGVQQLRNVIDLLDKPIPQVEIEAQFVSVTQAYSRAFGIDFTTRSRTGNLRGRSDIDVTPDQTAVVSFVGRNFQATLNALAAQNFAEIVSSPRITTLNNLTANLSAYSRQYIISTTTTLVPGANGTFATAVTERVNTFTTGVSLTVTPTINRDGTITISMTPVVSSPAPSGGRFPIINGQTIDTISNVKDGDTLAIGGLRGKSDATTERRIPLLSRLPLLGKLFGSKSNAKSSTELIIFVTARIVRRTDEPVPGT